MAQGGKKADRVTFIPGNKVDQTITGENANVFAPGNKASITVEVRSTETFNDTVTDTSATGDATAALTKTYAPEANAFVFAPGNKGNIRASSEMVSRVAVTSDATAPNGTATAAVDITEAPHAETVIVAPGNHGNVQAYAFAQSNSNLTLNAEGYNAFFAAKYVGSPDADAVIYTSGKHGSAYGRFGEGASLTANATADGVDAAAGTFEATITAESGNATVTHGHGDWHL